MSFIKKLVNLFSKENQTIKEIKVDGEKALSEDETFTTEDQTAITEDTTAKIDAESTQLTQGSLEILQSAKEGEVEEKPTITNAPQKVSFTSAEFKKIAEDKYFDKRRRLTTTSANLQKNISNAENAKASTDNKYLIGLADEDIAGKMATLENIDSLLNNVTAEDFVVAMAHKSKIESISLLQKLLAKMKKKEREALARMSIEVRGMIKGCRPILPGDIDETVKAIEDKIVE